jgi:hypothetical protein
MEYQPRNEILFWVENEKAIDVCGDSSSSNIGEHLSFRR